MQEAPLLSSGSRSGNKLSFWQKLKGTILQIAEELMAPPTLGAVCSHEQFISQV